MRKFFATLAFVTLMMCIGYASDPAHTGIVAEKSFTGLTSNLSSQSIYTPDTTGVFRVDVIAVFSTGGVNLGGNNSLSWTDDYSTSQTSNGTPNNNNNIIGNTYVIRDGANNAISLTTNYISSLGGGHVDIYVTVERLQ